MALDRPALRKLIGTVLPTDGDLDAFCLDYLPKIHARFTIGMDRVQKVTMILQLANLAELERYLRGMSDPPPEPSTSPGSTSEGLVQPAEGFGPPLVGDAPIPSPSAEGKVKVLFLASLPSSVAPLDLGVEIRKIQEQLQSAKHRDRIQMQSEWAVRPRDIRRALLEHSPHIVHFSGHGEVGELIVEDDHGTAQPITKAALGALFGLLKDNIRVVLLNACCSRLQAEAISEHIDCVIGMNRPVGDKAAITFAATFYEAIGYGRSVKTAFDLATNAILLEGIPGHDIPELVVRAGAAPADLRLIKS